MSEAHTTPDSGNAFTRAFLPGLILGLVVGGFCGAFLPEIMKSPKPDFSHEAGDHAGEAGDRDPYPRDEDRDEGMGTTEGEDDAPDVTPPEGTEPDETGTDPDSAPASGDEPTTP